jgi:hypothetical protein
MLSDLLLIIGMALLAAAAFLFSPICALVILGAGCLIAALAFSDGKGVKWRS